jgi:HTH-type transcriptional regulator, transcriptional repressor of NAD biosynthesis genes
MKKGFLIGKFLPLHKGHLALMDFARQQCDFLYIVICHTKTESIDGLVRKQWLYSEQKSHENLSVISLPYDDSILPNTSVSSREVSQKWALELKKIVPDVDLIFSSEKYGDYLAEFMGIQHIIFDEKRDKHPVSASMINKESFKYWDYIVDSAKPWFVKKIVLLGSESTGKSTLAEKLAVYFNTTYVPEMAREIVEKTNDCTFEMLEEIALLHAKKIAHSISIANKLLFIDTDITITKSYSHFLFNQDLIVDGWVEEASKADLYLFLETDCSYIQDGTRLIEKERNRLSLFHKQQLSRDNIDYISIGGNWDNRFETAVDLIKKKYFA